MEIFETQDLSSPNELFGKKWFFVRNVFSAKTTFAKFKMAFWPEIAFLVRYDFLPNLKEKRTYDLQ
jgi:hypothetical protein